MKFFPLLPAQYRSVGNGAAASNIRKSVVFKVLQPT